MPRTKVPSELLPGTLDMLILQTLTLQSMHGYAIAQHIRRLSDSVLSVEQGSLYPALYRLESQGFLKSEWGESENKRKAKFYSLTASGRKRLRTESEGWARFASAVAAALNA